MNHWLHMPKRKELLVNKEKLLEKDHACYVLITCGHPTTDGKMCVELTYEGDASLAAYLLESAQGFIETDEETLSN